MKLAQVVLGKWRCAQQHHDVVLLTSSGCGKASQFLAGLQVEPTVNWHQDQFSTNTRIQFVEKG